MPVPSATSSATSGKLRTLFAQFGIPKTVMSDNTAYFTSQEFEIFLKKNGSRHLTSSAYHPSSNGLAERAVQIFKQGLKKVKEGSLESRIAKLLFTYCTTPHSTTGRVPAELLLGKILRIRLDLLFPSPVTQVEEIQSQQKRAHNATCTSTYIDSWKDCICSELPSRKHMDSCICHRTGWSSIFHSSIGRWTS